MRRVRLLVCAVLVTVSLAAPRAGRAQGGQPLGPEFRVNTYTTGAQNSPAVARDAAGNFVVAWDGEGQDDPAGLFGQRFAPSGVPLGPEFRVNTATTDFQSAPTVAAASAGSFVVAWTTAGGYGGTPADVFGQRYAGDGTPLGSEFRINTYTTGAQDSPAMAADTAGNFIVVWDGEGQAEPISGVFGQRFAASGAPLGPEFRVNTSTTDLQSTPAVAAGSGGSFVVVWTSSGGYGGTPADVFGQRFASDGTPLGTEFRVNTYTTAVQDRAAVAADPAGNFIVVWDGEGQDDPNGVYAQRFASSGAALGPEFRVNTSTTDFQFGASVGVDSAGNFVVAWTDSAGYGGSGPDLFGQRYLADGTPLGGQFLVNTYTTLAQNRAAVAADPAGNFVVTWDSYGQDGSLTGVFGQRFGQIVPVELIGIRVE
jgi:hypothetical protein